jgi:sortase B
MRAAPRTYRRKGARRYRSAVWRLFPHPVKSRPHVSRAGGRSRNSRAYRRRRKYRLRRALAALCLAGFLTTGALLYRYVSESRQTRATNESIAALYHEAEVAVDAADAAPTVTPAVPAVTGVLLEKPSPTKKPKAIQFQKTKGDILPKFAKLKRVNKDIAGWLTINGVVDLPVVYRDNSYYLRRDIHKKKSSAGTLFLDEDHPPKATAQNLIIHGHNMKDGSMFGKLSRYLRLNYLQKHCVIQFDTLYQENTYVVIAVLTLPDDVRDPAYFNYLGYPSFRSSAEFQQYVGTLTARSAIEIPIETNERDALLTLSTCYGDDRLLVVARRVRNGEDVAALKEQVMMARAR